MTLFFSANKYAQ